MDKLTNEELKKGYKNNFDLASLAISIARDKVSHEEQTSLKEILDELREVSKENLEKQNLEKQNNE